MAVQVVEKVQAFVNEGVARLLLEEVCDPSVMDIYVNPQNPAQVEVSLSGREQHCAVHSLDILFSSEQVVPGWQKSSAETCLGFAHYKLRRLN